MMYCPHCHSEIDHLTYTANYTEYGRESGTASLDFDDLDREDMDTHDSETDDPDFFCPECDATLYNGDLLDDLPEDEEEEEEEIINETAEDFNIKCFNSDKAMEMPF